MDQNDYELVTLLDIPTESPQPGMKYTFTSIPVLHTLALSSNISFSQYYNMLSLSYHILYYVSIKRIKITIRKRES